MEKRTDISDMLCKDFNEMAIVGDAHIECISDKVYLVEEVMIGSR